MIRSLVIFWVKEKLNFVFSFLKSRVFWLVLFMSRVFIYICEGVHVPNGTKRKQSAVGKRGSCGWLKVSDYVVACKISVLDYTLCHMYDTCVHKYRKPLCIYNTSLSKYMFHQTYIIFMKIRILSCIIAYKYVHKIKNY